MCTVPVAALGMHALVMATVWVMRDTRIEGVVRTSHGTRQTAVQVAETVRELSLETSFAPHGNLIDL